MNEQQAFHEAMRADPNDKTTRLVYADWLDDHGKSEAAHRIRWWMAAKDHLDAGPTSGSAVPPNVYPDTVETRGMPEWLARLNQVRGVRKMWTDAPAGKHAGALDALHEAELHAYGLHSLDDSDLARRRAGNIRPDTLRPEGIWAHDAINGVLRQSAHNHLNYPVYAAMRHAIPTMNTYSAPAMQAHTRDTQRLRDFAVTNPPEKPVQLARPLGWLKDRILGAPEPVRGPGDGIVHKADNPTAVYAEKNAVLHAIRLLGGTEAATPDRAHRYMNYVAGFVKTKPDHPLVKAYIDKAKMAGGTAGPELTEAVKPLVGAVNLLMHAHGKDSRFVKPVSAAAPVHVPPEHRSTEPKYEVVPDAPVDLGEHTPPAEDAHTAIMRMTKDVLAGKANREDIVKHLMDAHGSPTRTAALARIRAAINRANVLHARSKGPTKLAAYTGGTIGPQHIQGNTAARDPYTDANMGFHRQLAGTSMAYHLRQIQQKYPHLAGAADAALTGRRHGPSAAQDDPFVAIGTELKSLGSPLANAHDWNNITSDLHADAKVHQAVKKLVSEKGLERFAPELKELRYWDRVHAAHKHTNGEEFYRRLANATGLDKAALQASIGRITDRELDRVYLASKPKAADVRDVMGAK